MRLSVIIPTLNGADTIGAQLEALGHQELQDGWEVIIADNGSADRTPEGVAAYASRLPGLRVIKASGASGAAHARNTGAKHAVGDALLFCDDDDEVGEGWLAAMGRALLQHRFVACRADGHKLNAWWVGGPHG